MDNKKQIRLHGSEIHKQILLYMNLFVWQYDATVKVFQFIYMAFKLYNKIVIKISDSILLSAVAVNHRFPYIITLSEKSFEWH